MKYSIYYGTSFIGSLLALAFVFSPTASYATTISLTNQMALGSSGSQVSALQQFLAEDPHIYPAGLVTGYFGPLTVAAVNQFQLAYGLPVVGQVGPLTLARINEIGSENLMLDVTAPTVSNITQNISQTTGVIGWTTSEPTRAKIYYDVQPLTMSEADANFVEPTISGQVVADANTGMSHSVSLQNLFPNITYYYALVSVDASGNVTVTPGGTFTTMH